MMLGGWCQRDWRVSWTSFSSRGSNLIGQASDADVSEKASVDKFECRDARTANAAFFCALPTAAQAPRIGCGLLSRYAVRFTRIGLKVLAIH